MSNERKRSSVGFAVLFLGATVVMIGGEAQAQTVLTNNDGIIRNSLCVGFDCANNETFGFDTIRMKENNTRIHFEDTSTAAGFPSTDWEITANDSASGGANYLGIMDRTVGRRLFAVSGGAPSNSLFVASTGRVGLRTATPVLDLHINTSNTPGQRLEQNSSGGFAAQTWDIAGNEANFFVRDVTGGSRLPFRIRPGAPTSSIDIAASGNVGIGTASPAHPLDVVRTSGSFEVARFQNSGAGGASARFVDSSGNNIEVGSQGGLAVIRTASIARIAIDTAGNVGIGTSAPSTRLHTTGGVRFAGVANCTSGIQSDANGNLSCITSSRRFKNVEGELAAEVALANVMALKPYVGAYKQTPDEPEHWLIAEEVAGVDRALVGLADGEPYTVKTHGVVTDLVAVIQQQQRRIDALEEALRP